MRNTELYAGTETWLEAKKGIISATDAVGLLGLYPLSWTQKTPLAIWSRLTGKPTEDDEPSKPMRWGIRSERFVADEWCRENQWETTLYDAGELILHPDLDWLGATPDFFYTTDEEPEDLRVLEVKAPTDYTAESQWSDIDSVPSYYKTQLQMQMAITELNSEGTLVAGAPTIDIQPYRFDFNPRQVEAIMNYLVDFREKHWLQDSPPRASGADESLLKLLHPKDDGQAVILGNDATAAWERLQSVKEDLKPLEAEKKELSALVRQAIGLHTWAKAGDQWLSYKTSHRDGYTVQPSTRRTLRPIKSDPGAVIVDAPADIPTLVETLENAIKEIKS